MTFLEKVVQKNEAKGLCESCKHLIKISDTGLGCTAHDKLIMPEYIPYSNLNNPCKDWREK